MTKNRPAQALATLLDALEAELLSASDTEIFAAQRETARVPAAAVQEVRDLLETAHPSPLTRTPAKSFCMQWLRDV